MSTVARSPLLGKYDLCQRASITPSMTQTPHDQFSKQYLKGMLSPFTQEITISFELTPGEAQQVDLWFVPQTRQPIPQLGRLGQMAIAAPTD
ncbi:MAG: hypothetical protein VKJ24_18145 [Synechococcales bacterium]|nr:hypothetical protein [Synechococcales bacterium]